MDDGSLDRAQFPGADIFCVSSLAALIPSLKPREVKRVLSTDAGSHFHLYPIYSDEGRPLTWATAPNSFAAGWDNRKVAKRTASHANLLQKKYPRFKT